MKQETFTLGRAYFIKASHFIKDPENEETYHGHRYRVEVYVSKKINDKTGISIHRKFVDKVVRSQIIDKYNHTNLNENFSFSSGEYLAKKFLKILKNSPIKDYVTHVSIQETRKNRFCS